MSLVDDIAGAQDLPLEAMEAALRTPDRIAGGVLRAVEKAAGGTPLSEREQNLLFWGIHVLAQVRDTRLFAPLVTLLHRPSEEIEAVLGETINATMPRILASVFGDPEAGRAEADRDALVALVVDPAADEFVRWNAFGALNFLTFADRIPRDVTHAFLVRFDDERLARAGDATWNGWAEGIALLGFVDLDERFTAALASGRLLDDVCDPAWFQAVSFEAVTAPDDASRFDMHGFGYVEDAIEELDELLAMVEPEEDIEPDLPRTNPVRDVGRNDPCPCGSGRKFKKCCLGKDEIGAPAAAASSIPRLPPGRAR